MSFIGSDARLIGPVWLNKDVRMKLVCTWVLPRLLHMNASGMYVQQVPNYVRLVQLVDRQVGLRDRVFTIAN